MSEVCRLLEPVQPFSGCSNMLHPVDSDFRAICQIVPADTHSNRSLQLGNALEEIHCETPVKKETTGELLPASRQLIVSSIIAGYRFEA